VGFTGLSLGFINKSKLYDVGLLGFTGLSRLIYDEM
jgi:hypothetical protein